MGHDAGAVDHDLDVLPGRVEDLENVRIVHQREERLQVDSGGEGVDQPVDRLARHLDQAQVRPVGRLPHEFGVDGDETLLGQAVAEAVERFGGGNQVHAAGKRDRPLRSMASAENLGLSIFRCFAGT